jgi:Flp pilus assembly protein TadB
VKDRLKREQAERTRIRIAELLVVQEQDSEGEEEAEQGSEVEQLLRQSRQLLEQVEEERKGTVRVSVSCCYCAVCLVVCIVVLLCSLLVVLVGRQQTRNGTQQD